MGDFEANAKIRDIENLTPIYYVGLYSGNVDMVQYLMRANGGSIDEQFELTKQSNLHTAVMNGHLEVVKFLLICGANVDSTDDGKYTPLHLAAMMRNVEMIALLIDCGAEVDARSCTNETPTDVASELRYYDIVTYLMQNGAC